MGWSVLVPVRSGGKSRLHAPGDWSRACALDTLAAIRGCAVVDHVRTLGQAFDDVEVIQDHGRGLNFELTEAAVGMSRPLAIILGDLPSLTPQDLLNVLTQAAEHVNSMVIDHEGSGTTMVMSTASALVTYFGVDSAALHKAAGFHPLEAPIRTRLDVDTYEDLLLAHDLGLGVNCSTLLRDN